MMKNKIEVLLMLFALCFLPACSNDDDETTGGGSIRTTTAYSSFTVSVDTVNKYFDVKMKCVPATDTLSLMLPIWTPGCYTVMEFSRQLTDFNATDNKGNKLTWSKRDRANWRIPCANVDTVNISYRIYGNVQGLVSGIAGRIINTMAFMLPASVFMYQENQKDKPVTVHFDMPSNWKYITTPLSHDANNTVTAENIDELYDSPFLLGNQNRTLFDYEGHPYEVAHWDGLRQDLVASYLDDLKKVITADKEIMGDIPYDKYCFMFLYGDGGSLEHACCQTDFIGNVYLKDDSRHAKALITFAHEYFHLYNVKRIHPFELGPFDYQHEAYCPTLWFCEGVTHYYTFKSLLKAGIVTPDSFNTLISNNIYITQTYDGRKYMSLRQSSLDIFLNFSNDNANANDVTISYYIKGPVVGMLMDAYIINATNGQKSLDDVMRKLYAFCKTTGRGYTEEELWQMCEEVCGKSMSDIRRYVDTTDEIDYETMLAPVGLTVDRATWKIVPVANATATQLKYRNIMTYQQ